MPTVYPLITEKQTFFDANSNELAGGKLFVYAANSTTKVTSYAETDGVSANSNPIVLNSRGEVPNGLYVPGAAQYKLVLAPSTDTDPPSSPIWTRDDLEPIGYISQSAVSQWQTSGSVATQTSATAFTVPGDQRGIFQIGRRVRATITAPPQLSYGTIGSASFGSGVTTVALSVVSTNLDTGMTGTIPDVGLLTGLDQSIPVLVDPRGSGTFTMTGTIALSGNATVGTAAVAGGRLLAVTNSDAGATSFAQSTVQSDGGRTLTMQQNSGAFGGSSSLWSAASSGLSVYTNNATPLNLGTNGSTNRVVIDSSGNLTVNGSVAASMTFSSGAVPVAKNTAKAWVNFNGTGTVAIRDSFNVTSITDNGVGDYTVNFTAAASSANYAYFLNGGDAGAGGYSHAGPVGVAPSTTAFRFACWGLSGFITDIAYVSAGFFWA